MYDRGRGVAKDQEEAVKWFRRAAEQGIAQAQYSLGVRYLNGQGVPKDQMQAVAWLSLAAANGAPDASKMRELAQSGLSTDQLDEAQVLSARWAQKQPRK